MPHPEPSVTQAHWDQMADTYDAAKHRNALYYQTIKECVEQAIPPAARRRVLEVGCGTGQVLASLRPLQGVGIDASPRMIAVARRQFADRSELTFATMDAATSQFDALGEFDAAISTDTVEHVGNWPAMVGHMVRACRRGGVVAVVTPNPLWAVPLWILERVHLKMPEGPHRFVSRRAIARTLADCGCEVCSSETRLFLPVDLGDLGRWASRLAWCRLLSRCFGVIQIVVARRT